MSFQIYPISKDDVPALAQLDEDAYEGNPLRESISSWHVASPEVRAQHLEWSSKMLLQRLQDEGTVFRKAVLESTGEPVGWAAWNKPKVQSENEDEKERKESKDDLGLSPCFNAAAAKEHTTLWQDMTEKYMGGKDSYWLLGKLAVDLRHPGAADALVKCMLSDVDESGLEAFTGSTPETVKMYEGNGFRIVETVPRLNGSYSFSFMVRAGREER